MVFDILEDGCGDWLFVVLIPAICVKDEVGVIANLLKCEVTRVKRIAAVVINSGIG